VAADVQEREEEDVAVLDELLVEEISIDGMCGVY
jgi:mycofactocin precursor